jgi:hypothetical protein
VSLGIPLTVKRCTHPEHQRGRRVRFVLGTRCRPGEAVVLRRWRDRSREPAARAKEITFEGCRLWPGTLQLLNACREAGFDLSRPFTAERLRPYYVRARQDHPTWKAPNPENMVALMTCLATKKKRLTQILGRARSTANPGLPDLFLWKRGKSGVPFGGQFIEVKRYVPARKFREPLSPDQRAELEFLKGKDVGAKARVAYLVER